MGAQFTTSYHSDDEENEGQNMTGVEWSAAVFTSMTWPLSPSSGRSNTLSRY